MSIGNPSYSPFVPGALVAAKCVVEPTTISLKVGVYSVVATPGAALWVDNGVMSMTATPQTTLSANTPQQLVLYTDQDIVLAPTVISPNLASVPKPGSVAGMWSVFDGTNYQLSFSSNSPSINMAGLIYYSTDMFTWQTKSIGSTAFMSASETGVNAFAYSTGVTNQYVWCAGVGTTTGAIWVSTDSITWASRDLGVASTTASGPFGVCINPAAATNKYVLLSRSGSSAMINYSTDGNTWVTAVFGFAGSPSGHVATNGTASTNQIYVYTQATATTNVATSTDGVSWTNRSTGLGSSTRQVLWWQNKYWVFASTSSRSEYATSTDGVTWTLAYFPFAALTNQNGTPFIHNNQLWVAGQNGHLYSTDGVSWAFARGFATQTARVKTDVTPWRALVHVSNANFVRHYQLAAFRIYQVDKSRTFN